MTESTSATQTVVSPLAFLATGNDTLNHLSASAGRPSLEELHEYNSRNPAETLASSLEEINSSLGEINRAHTMIPAPEEAVAAAGSTKTVVSSL